ncbi:Diguanylate cyclase/phosphodiesterase [Sterolibacterium denitrificans]|uniref:Diguanylate cyclase/phosphodiesterase n=2 Tax=Sterolibacterium denitrificans TaxID=157592 RepID=A0A7Z7HNL5_9PROT|nr:EAL domain-containing protein [Sterolibacterium denitrificans]KYC29025.1 hypothetical protein ACY05_00025 [Sterolibacterium denitrificans]SMB21239.1 Diguanylate cyclase/phosphodiesterase [Sterolibacterium denitrificans]
MSIYRQFLLAIIGLTALAFIGSFVVSVHTARKYIEQQLYMKNVDNAASLALVLSQLPGKDPVTVELVVSAQFDTGHYQQIVLTDPTGAVLIERHFTGNVEGAPEWFRKLFPLQAEAGVAQVQDGWKQFGTVQVASHSRFAYQSLWLGIKQLALWFLLAGLAAGAFGTWLLRLVFRPLGKVVEQAQAIQERRFITLPLPGTPELKAVVVAMNSMTDKVKSMFAQEAARLDVLRRQVNHDPLTNLPNRAFFMTWLQESLQNEESPAGGALALLRLTELEKLNVLLGYADADRLIRDIAQVLQGMADKDDNKFAARLNGADFAVLAGGEQEAERLAASLLDGLGSMLGERWPQIGDVFHLGVVPYQRGDQPGHLLAASDKALAIAESKGPNCGHTLQSAAQAVELPNGEAWKLALTEALSDGRIRLERYPVMTSGGRAMHEEAVTRLQATPGGKWLSAGDFMPMMLRLKLYSELDMNALQIALDQLDEQSMEIAVNLSANSITDWRFRDTMQALLVKNVGKCSRLWIEVPEYGAFRNFDAFASFCNGLAPLGCKIGIEHFGRHFGEIAKLAELGLDYLKVDSSYIRDIQENTGNQSFLKGLCQMAHTVGILVIAEGVMNDAELDTLVAIGFDGITGQAVTRPAA